MGEGCAGLFSRDKVCGMEAKRLRQQKNAVEEISIAEAHVPALKI
jgi:hypothetical protein